MYSETDISDIDAKENKEQFALGFKDVQESFYDLCSKLEKTQTGITLCLSPLISFSNFSTKNFGDYKFEKILLFSRMNF